MRTISHHQLGHFLGQRYLSNASPTQLRFFLLGCTQPDKNPATYLKGSIKYRWLHGHDYSNCKTYIFRLCRKLQSKTTWTWKEYYALGKLIHYIADTFTYAHSASFDGNLSQHRQYEQRLHEQLSARLSKSPNSFPRISPYAENNIKQYRRLYCQLTPQITIDLDFSIGVAMQVMDILTPNRKS